MKVKKEFLMKLIEEDNPLNSISQELLNLWLNIAKETDNIGDYYYKGEEIAKDFEEFILKSYWEFYDLLAKACLNSKSVFELYPEVPILLMDGMSIRESALLYKVLKNKGYNIKHDFDFSAIPSDTEFFRKKIKISMNKFFQINKPSKIRISGDEKYIWSYFPDIMLDKIKVGHTVISSLGEMYQIVEKIVVEILSKIKTNKIIITSDHGYIRTEAGFVFHVPNVIKKKLQDIFGSKRYIEMDDLDVNKLIEDGYITEFNGYYMAKSRYLWPVPGKYSIYIHGGLSLMECIVPVLIIEKEVK